MRADFGLLVESCGVRGDVVISCALPESNRFVKSLCWQVNGQVEEEMVGNRFMVGLKN